MKRAAQLPVLVVVVDDQDGRHVNPAAQPPTSVGSSLRIECWAARISPHPAPSISGPRAGARARSRAAPRPPPRPSRARARAGAGQRRRADPRAPTPARRRRCGAQDVGLQRLDELVAWLGGRQPTARRFALRHATYLPRSCLRAAARSSMASSRPRRRTLTARPDSASRGPGRCSTPCPSSSSRPDSPAARRPRCRVRLASWPMVSGSSAIASRISR